MDVETDVVICEGAKTVGDLVDRLVPEAAYAYRISDEHINSLRAEFPLDSECGEECLKVAKVYEDNRELFHDAREDLAKACLHQIMVICFS